VAKGKVRRTFAEPGVAALWPYSCRQVALVLISVL